MMKSLIDTAGLKSFQSYTNSILSAYAEILFIKNKKIGILLLIATFINPNVAISGLLGVVFVLLFAAYIRMDPEFLESGFYIYNPLLVGMSIGFLFKLSLVTVFLIAVASVLTFLVTIVLHTLFSIYLIPILSLPFAIVSSIVYLASLNYSNLFIETLYNHSGLLNGSIYVPVWIDSFFKSIGTILFLPNFWVGVFFFIFILFHSRIMAILAVAGYYFGVYIHSLLSGSFISSLLNPYGFNYVLVAIALGSIFLIPGIRSYLMAMLGVGISVLLVDSTAIFWTLYKIPVFTLPFNFTVISFLFVLRLVRYKEFAYVIKRTPENSLSYYLMSLFRFRTNEVGIFLPFSGTWSVYQAFDDIWTHQGRWRYAYDFVIRDKDGKSYKNSGNFPEDYYAFKKPVLSPVSGYVVEAVSHHKDNPIGEVDNINNWGNYLVLSTSGGAYVEVSHLAQNSLRVKKGDYVEAGQIVALCGNSGYSPEPHIHIQVQENSYLGSKTIPFNFVAYLKKESIFFYDRPKKDEKISSFSADKSLDSKFSFVLDSVYRYEVFEDEKRIDEFSIRVEMDRFSGRFFFEDEKKNRLFFAKDYGVFYFYDYVGSDSSYLKKFFIAVPRVPLVDNRRVRWRDTLTPRIVFGWFKKELLMFLASFFSRRFLYRGTWEKENDFIKGEIELNGRKIICSVKIDEIHFFDSIMVENLIIRRKK